MAKLRKSNSLTPPPAPRRMSRGTGFVLGVLAGLAIVAAVWFAYNAGKESAGTQAATASVPTAQAQISDAPPPPPAITDAEAAQAVRISAEEAKRLVDAGQAAVIDVRDAQSYAASHIPGALQIPLAFVQGELPWFPRDKTLIFYCT